MTYISSAQWTQISVPPPGAMAQFEVDWSYGPIVPEYLAFRYLPTGGAIPVVVGALLGTQKGKVVSHTTLLPAGWFGQVSICGANAPGPGQLPVIEDGTCFFQEVRVQAKEEPKHGEEACSRPPEIQSFTPQWGAVGVSWSNPGEYESYELEISYRGDVLRVAETDKTWYLLQRVEEGETYTFRVRGYWEGFLGFKSCLTPWSDPKDYPVPRGQGYKPPALSNVSHIAAVSRDPNHMDLFAIDSDGMPRTAGWDGNPWGMWQQLMAFDRRGGPLVRFAPCVPIECLSRNQKVLTVLAVDADGVMRLAERNRQGQWAYIWGNLGSAIFPEFCNLAATTRSPGFMDVFAIPRDGKLHVAWWSNDLWNDWTSLDGPDLLPGGAVAAVSRSSDYMDVASVGIDGQVKLRWWNGGWKDWHELGGASFPPGAPISLIARSSDHMDLFGVDTSGQLRNIQWNGQWSNWNFLPSPVLEPGTCVSATSRRQEHMEVFYVDQTGRLRSTWFYDGWKYSFVVAEAMSPPPVLKHVSSLSRNPKQLDVFVINSADGTVWSTWWHGEWRNPWFPI